MKLPFKAVIAREKVTDYLLVRQVRSDKSAFLAKGGFTSANPELLMVAIRSLLVNDATQVDENEFGRYFEIVGVLVGSGGVALRVKTVWMTEHLSGVTKFITLIPVETLRP